MHTVDPGLPKPLRVFIALVGVTGTATAAYLIQKIEWGPSSFGELGIFTLLVVVAGSFYLPVAPKIKTDVGAAALFAAALVLEPGAAALAGAVGVVSYTFLARFHGEKLRLPWYKYPFNAGSAALQMGLSSAVFHALAQADTILTPALLPAALAYYMVNTSLVSVAVGLQLRVNPLRFWVMGTRENGLAEVSLFAFGVLGAAVYHENPYAVAALVVPVGTIYMAISKLAASNGRLEGQVQERTADLARAKEYTDGILSSMIDSLIVVSPDQRIETVNPATCALLGYKEKELVGQPVATVLTDQGFTGAGFVDLILKGSISNVESTFVSKEGREIPISLSGSAMRGTDGDVRGILCVAQDSTERKRAEDEILRLGELNDQIISNTPMGMAVLTGNERVVSRANQAFCQTMGIDHRIVEGKPIGDVVVLNGLEKVMKSPNGYHAPVTEVHYTRPNGADRWLDVAVTPLPSDDETLVIVNDVTERKEIRERVQENARLASIGELAAGVAHELNNPLAGVLGFAQLLMAKAANASTKDDLAKIYEQAQRATKVVQNLLSFAREHKPERRYVNVNTAIEKAVALKLYDFSVSNIHLSLDIPRDIPKTMADEHQLQQVFLNILVNAEHAMKEANGEGSLRVTAQQTGEKIHITFTDDGPGIAPDLLKKIFNPFFTTKEVGKGTGLGLSICYGIMQEHGGTIWAESEIGQGSTFHIELPILAPDNGTIAAVLTDVTPSVPTQRFLVVDDEPVVRDLLFQVLSADGHTVDLASGGQEAWDMIREERYSCIVADLRMPGVSGQDLYRRIREADSRLAEKVIFITGDMARPDVRAFLESTGNPVMGKPFDLSELRWHVSKLSEQ